MALFNWVQHFKNDEFWVQKIQNELYSLVKKFMREKDLTFEAFGNKIGHGRSYVSQILNGRFDHKLSKLVQLAKAVDKAPVLLWLDLDFYAKHAANGLSEIDIVEKHIKQARQEEGSGSV